MKPNDEELDRLIDALLQETFGSEPAPDLKARILARVPDQKRPVSRRVRRLQTTGDWWMAGAAAVIGVILVAALWNGADRKAAPTARTRKSIEKAPPSPEMVSPRQPEPLPTHSPAPGEREPKPSTSTTPEPERPIQPVRQEEPKKTESEPAPRAVPSPPKEDRVTRVEGIARIEQVEGDVELLDGENRLPARAGHEILPQQGLTTSGLRSRVLVKYPDGTSVELGPDGQVRNFLEGAGRGKTFFLSRGVILAEVKKQSTDRPMILATPHGEARVLGTTLRLRVDPADKGATRLDVVEGKVRFVRLSNQKSVDVVTGHYAVAAGSVDLVSRPIGAVRTGTLERPAIVALQAMNADTGQPLLQLDPIEDRMVISLSELPTRNLNIRAVTSPESVGCIVFNLDGEYSVEGRSPFMLMGNDAAGKPRAWTPTVGDHVLTVTAYSGGPAPSRREGLGNAGAPLTVRFRIR